MFNFAYRPALPAPDNSRVHFYRPGPRQSLSLVGRANGIDLYASEAGEICEHGDYARFRPSAGIVRQITAANREWGWPESGYVAQFPGNQAVFAPTVEELFRRVGVRAIEQANRPAWNEEARRGPCMFDEMQAHRKFESAAREKTIACRERIAAGISDPARKLLSNPPLRADVIAVVKSGRIYAAHLGARKMVTHAVTIMRERLARRDARAVAEAARLGQPGRIIGMAVERATPQSIARRLLERARFSRAIARKLLGRADVRRAAQEISQGKTVELVLRAIGNFDDQTETDLREFRSSASQSGKQGRHHRFDASNLHRIEIKRDWSAALLTMRDFVSFGRAGGSGYDTTRGVSFRCYLAVRDSTTGHCHVLRVPPKFGNEGTKFYGSFSDGAARIEAARAWTFSMEPKEFAPAVEA